MYYKDGVATVFVLGGKYVESGQEVWLNQVEKLEIKKDQEYPETWQAVSPMSNARALFAAVVIEDYIYSIGGIQEKKEECTPVLATV